MKDATITQTDGKPESQPQGMYQSGKYPSVIDTDDLVLEMGLQLVGNVNKSKLLDNMLIQFNAMKKALDEALKARQIAEEKVAPLMLSNKQYVQNNQKLDAELVRLRGELETTKKNYEEKITKIKGIKKKTRKK